MRRWWQATRPYSFTAAAVPVALGTGLAPLLHPGLAMDWIVAALALAGAVAAQAVSNLVNDYVDARTGLDHAGNEGRSNCIVAGLLSPGAVLRLAAACAALATAIGLYLAWATAPIVLALMVAGALLAVFYTAPPLQLKYRALGDLAVFLAFGALILVGAYAVQAHGMAGYLDLPRIAVLAVYGLPPALLVVAILHANNHRDRPSDRASGARTLANLLPPAASRALLWVLLAGAYGGVAAAAVAGLATRWTLLALLSLPLAVPIARRIRADDFGGDLVPRIAQLHGIFGGLLAMGVGVAARLG
jgi:1,4-dihydroxy-2-naphthoate octaprenyltransferase